MTKILLDVIIRKRFERGGPQHAKTVAAPMELEDGTEACVLLAGDHEGPLVRVKLPSTLHEEQISA